MNDRYTGVGSRSTPHNILVLMTEFAQRLYHCGFTLRSGGAQGADSAFESGSIGRSEIYIPWPGFQGRYKRQDQNVVYEHVSDAALEMAAQFHPAWHRCSTAARKLHARNCYQVLGPGLDDPSEFLICWTPNGSGSGGTGQAIRIANYFDVKVYDLGLGEDEIRRFARHLKYLESECIMEVNHETH